jgi:fucose permease
MTENIELSEVNPRTPSQENKESVPDGKLVVSEAGKSTGLRANIQFFTLCWSMFLIGWSDGSTGPLLPRIQSVYHVGFARVSVIFIGNCIGFVTGSILNVFLTDKLGFGKTIVLGSVAQMVAFGIRVPAPPFPLFAMAYAINGFGTSFVDAQANGFVASYKDNAAAKMGVLHAAYGFGALTAPLVATQFAQLHRWSFHYLASFGFATLNTVLLVCVFKFKVQDECLAQIGQLAEERESVNGSKYKEMFKLKALHLLALFILVYVGVEVTIGGWIVTYIIQVRHGGPSSGYIATGFFGGLTAGRVCLLWVNKKLGARVAIYVYAVLAIGFALFECLLPWLIHSYPGSSSSSGSFRLL